MATTSATAATTSAAAAALPGYNNVGLGGPDPEVIAAVEQRGNVVVFFDMVLGGEKTDGPADLGRIKLELFVKDVSTRNNVKRLSVFERVIKQCVANVYSFISIVDDCLHGSRLHDLSYYSYFIIFSIKKNISPIHKSHLILTFMYF